MRQFDLQRIRKEHMVTQKALSEMTGYPQGFISVIERGKASAPEAFIAKVQEIFGIKDITPYIIYVSNLEIRAAKQGLIKEKKPSKKKASKPKEKPAPSVPGETAAQVAQEQSIVSSFLEILKKKEAKIEKLEAENEMLKQQLLKAQQANS